MNQLDFVPDSKTTEAEDATKEAGLDFELRLDPTVAVRWADNDRTPRLLDTGGCAVTALASTSPRADHHADLPFAVDTVLGHGFSAGYTPHSNLDLARLVDRLRAEGVLGNVKAVESYRGHTYFLIFLTAGTYELPGGDVIERETIAGQAHDGSAPLFWLDNARRPVCDNQFGYGVPSLGRTVASTRHTSGMPERLKAATNAIVQAQARGDRFERDARALAEIQISGVEAGRYFRGVYSATVSPEPARQVGKDKRWHKWFAKWETVREEWYDRFDHESPVSGYTAWVAFNAVTYWSDHQAYVRATTADDTSKLRTFGALLGGGADRKRRALAHTLKYFGVTS